MADPPLEGSGTEHHDPQGPDREPGLPSPIKSARLSPHLDEPFSPQEHEESFASPRRPPLTPFFTLIEDTSSSTHHHPDVHYIFSDDDQDIVTQAAFQSLAANSSRDRSPSASNTKLGEEQAQERYVVLDINATGDGVTAAHSLSADWQVLGVEVSTAPTWEGETNTPAGGASSADGQSLKDTDETIKATKGLMLRIEGTEVPPEPAEVSRARSEEQEKDKDKDKAAGASGGAPGRSAVEGSADRDRELLALFERNMEMIRKVLHGDAASSIQS